MNIDNNDIDIMWFINSFSLLTCLLANRLSFFKAFALRYMKIVAGLWEGRHNSVHADLRTQTAIHGELVVGEGLDLAKTEAALNADKLYGHVLPNKRAGAGEGLHNTLIEGARIPGA